MVLNSLDRETYLIFPLFALGTGATLGLISTDILPLIDLGDTLISTAGIDWTYGRVLSSVSLIYVLFNRQASISDTSGIDLWATWVTLGLIIAPPFFPALADTLAQQPAAWVAFTAQSVGFAVISYLN